MASDEGRMVNGEGGMGNGEGGMTNAETGNRIAETGKIIAGFQEAAPFHSLRTVIVIRPETRYSFQE